MYLMYCNKCADVVRLLPGKGLRRCLCGSAHGENKDTYIEINKNAILFDISDIGVIEALVAYDDKLQPVPISGYPVRTEDNGFVKIIP